MKSSGNKSVEVINRQASLAWQTSSDSEKQFWRDKAAAKSHQHRIENPGYRLKYVTKKSKKIESTVTESFSFDGAFDSGSVYYY